MQVKRADEIKVGDVITGGFTFVIFGEVLEVGPAVNTTRVAITVAGATRIFRPHATFEIESGNRFPCTQTNAGLAGTVPPEFAGN
jgi:hypothetical protein